MGSGREDPSRKRASTHDILVAWQAGRIPYRRAMSLTGSNAITDLYVAAGDSGVPIRRTMLPGEAAAAERATKALFELGVKKAANPDDAR